MICFQDPKAHEQEEISGLNSDSKLVLGEQGGGEGNQTNAIQLTSVKNLNSLWCQISIWEREIEREREYHVLFTNNLHVMAVR